MRKQKKNNLTFEKVKGNTFSAAIYDLIKCFILFIVSTFGITFIALKVKFLDFMFYPLRIQVFLLIIFTLVIVILTSLFLNMKFKKKYNQLEVDNFTDELTGLKNHKALKSYLSSAIIEFPENSLSLILMDVDDFKLLNSKTSHTIADQILRKLGKSLDDDKRNTDKTFRYFLRGDEFIVVAKDTSLNQAYIAAERKRKLIESSAYEVNNEFYNLTVCCGVTEVQKNDDYSSFADRVSKALAIAKEVEGKNCTRTLN